MSPPDEGRGYVTTMITWDLFDALVAYCESYNTTRAEVLRGALEKWAKNEPTVNWPKKGTT